MSYVFDGFTRVKRYSEGGNEFVNLSLNRVNIN